VSCLDAFSHAGRRLVTGWTLRALVVTTDHERVGTGRYVPFPRGEGLSPDTDLSSPSEKPGLEGRASRQEFESSPAEPPFIYSASRNEAVDMYAAHVLAA
jgi:hypothetical protein